MIMQTIDKIRCSHLPLFGRAVPASAVVLIVVSLLKAVCRDGELVTLRGVIAGGFIRWSLIYLGDWEDRKVRLLNKTAFVLVDQVRLAVRGIKPRTRRNAT
jgi:hypothetical protein